ncbi:hypothetical protein [Pseudoduganella sp. UC29_71]|jgi:hypothetical protein|uniref:hypothetical protein n=1 Tax=Pseudoduganella sp. UC29_71 TaxID=3350174 RepID=UPI00366BE1C3
MRFYFLHNDKMLTTPASQGGCGVTDQEIREITVWQNNMDYKFELHLENHGPYVYIFPDGRRAGQKNMPRYSFGGGRVSTFDSDDSLTAGIRADVRAVVDNNLALFARIHERFYGQGGVPKQMADRDDGPKHAYFVCNNPECSGKNRPVTVEFSSAAELRREIKVSHSHNINSAEYPVIRCPKKTCGWSMELVEKLDAPDIGTPSKDTIRFGA